MSESRGTAADERQSAAAPADGTTVAVGPPRKRRTLRHSVTAVVVLLLLGALLGIFAVRGAGMWKSAPVAPPVAEESAGGAVIPSGKLTWAPPELLDPEMVVVGPGERNLKLDPVRDYTVVLPDRPVDLGGGVTVDGGRNVVILGGVISIPSREQVRSDLARRGLYLKGQTGTIHVEGVHITGDVSDGINLDERQGAVVQIENVLIDRVHGSAGTHHADVIQTWAGPRALRIDGLRATTEYQGFFLLPNQLWKTGPPPEEVTIRRSLLTMEPGSGYALWLPARRPGWLDKSGLHVQVPAGKSRKKLTWPDSQLGLKLFDDTTVITLDLSDPGPRYRSPGYEQQ